MASNERTKIGKMRRITGSRSMGDYQEQQDLDGVGSNFNGHHQQQQQQQQQQQRGRSNTDPTAATASTITPSPSVPSLLSPVGESRNYCIALDEDDIIDLSAVVPTPTMVRTKAATDAVKSGNRRNPRNNNNANLPRSPRFYHNRHHLNDNGGRLQGNDDGDQCENSQSSPSRFSMIFSPSNGEYLEDGEHFGSVISPLLHNNDDADEDDVFFFRHHADDHLHRESTTNADSRARVRLNGLNYLNVLTYGLNAFVSFCIGYAGLWGVLPTRWQISKDYETLVTPAEFAYYLWAPILVFELIFALAQLLPNYRARPIIQQGTGYFFFWTCFIQTAWTLFFAFEWFICSFICAVIALLSLASLLASQHYYCVMNGRSANHSNTRSRRLEYWLFRFPFYLHCGWLIMCTIVQFSIIFRYYTSNIGVQLSADIFSLGIMLPAATFFLTGQPSGPDFVIPIVVIWSYVSIAIELGRPSEILIDLYGHASIVAIRNASIFFAGTVGVMLVPRVVIWIAQEFCTIRVVEFDDDDDDEGGSQYRFYSPPTYHQIHHDDNALNSERGSTIRSIEEELDDDDDYGNHAAVESDQFNAHQRSGGNNSNNNIDDGDFNGEYYNAQNGSTEIHDRNAEEVTNAGNKVDIQTTNDELV